MCISLRVMNAAVISREGVRGEAGGGCTAGLYDGTDGGEMRLELGADLRSSLRCLFVSASLFPGLIVGAVCVTKKCI